MSHPQPHFLYQNAYNGVGTLLVVFLTLVISLALTGVWPLLVNTSLNIDILVAREEEAGTSKSGRCGDIWLIASGFVTVLLSGIAAHLICTAMRWPNVTKIVQVGTCYFIETATLSQPTGSRLLAGEDGPRAEVTLKDNGDVDFVTNCESSMYEPANGVLWRLVPQYRIECVNVPCIHILDMRRDRQSHCGWTKWNPDVSPGTYDGFTGSFDVGSIQDGHCGFLGIPRHYWRASVSYKVDRSEMWQFCYKAEQPTYIERVAGNSTQTIIDFEKSLTVDSYALGRQDGWYTSGTQEIISHASFDGGAGSSLVFKDLDDNGLREHVRQYHAVVGTQDVHIIRPFGVNVQPNSLQCRMLFTLANGNRYEEFQEPCVSMSVSKSDDRVSGIKIMTTHRFSCTVSVGFGSDNRTTTVLISALYPATMSGADRWRCTTLGVWVQTAHAMAHSTFSSRR
jgi:hypothetical protein